MWLAVAVLAGVTSGLYLVRSTDRPAPVRSAAEVARELVTGEFSLTDHTGRPVTDRDYRGSWRLVFFGYTHCPDVCPTALATVALVLDELAGDADRLQPLFVTIDPDRDTTEVMADYVAAFHPRIVGLTGSPDAVAAAAKAYRVYYARAPLPGETAADAGDYAMDHTGYFYLMDPDGAYATVFSPYDSAEDIARKISARLAG